MATHSERPDAIEIDKDGLTAIEEHIFIGQSHSVETRIRKENFDEYSVKLNQASVPLTEFLRVLNAQPSTAGDIPKRIDFTLSDAIEVEINENDKTERSDQGEDKESAVADGNSSTGDEAKKEIVQRRLQDDELPDLPDVRNFSNKTNEQYYKRLVSSEDSQPSVLRKIIFNEKEASKEELKQLMERKGYNPRSSGFGASLRVLDEVTGEIERKGRGDDQTIRWTGSG